MLSVMNNDLDSEMNNEACDSEVDKPRVSNDGSAGVVNDMNSKEGVRVYTGQDVGTQRSEIDEISVLPGLGKVGDDARVLGRDSDNSARGEASSGNGDIDGDRGVEFRVRDEELGNSKVGVITSSHEHSVGSGNLDAASRGKQKASRKYAGRKIYGKSGDLSLKMSTNMQAFQGSDNVSSNSNVVIRGVPKKILGSNFEMGDMVWAKVKSHPWWPGHIYNEAFASSSVRRTKRDGHMLVAFFGDSSYGWFSPSELIPYGPHYAEKSKQTNSRSFMNAVEESVDEASRRAALGLSCRCRNPSNFKPTNVSGYFVVDVVDHEPGAIYLASQIHNARENFKPAGLISFIKQLAVAPMSNGSKSLDFIKQKAVALAYRRSTFEEFDETYAQAFGHEPVRPSKLSPPPTNINSSQAPISGPLVVAETPGGRKNSSKAIKPKDLSKKDKYLLKRRDEAGNLRASQSDQIHASSSLTSAYEDGTLNSTDYVFQKRDHTTTTNGGRSENQTRDQMATSGQHMTTKDAPAGLGATVGPDVSGKKSSHIATGSSQQFQSDPAMAAEVTNVKVQDSDSHFKKITSSDAGRVKKKNLAKRPAGELISGQPDVSEKEKKKKKKLKKPDGERTLEHSEKLLSASDGAFMVKPTGKALMHSIPSSREDSQASDRKKDNEVSNSILQQVGSETESKVEENDVELRQMLADLQGLARNPFYTTERNNRLAIARRLFLKFRSSVYLKANSVLPTAESELIESQAVRYVAGDKLPTDGSKNIPSMKSTKLSSRHEDATKGQKRLPSERQEEIAVKRAKKFNEVKSMGAEKSTTLKNAELPKTDGKVKFATAQQSSFKPIKREQLSKRVDRPPRVEEPTYLIMKFQAGSSLPSLVELKARFARFGPLDTSLSRVFYKTNTCRVAFLYRQDANVAYRYAVASKSLFSNVKFILKPVASSEPPKPNKTEDLLVDLPSNRDSSTLESRSSAPINPLVQQQPGQQLKSCLKKPSAGDDPIGPNNGSGNIRTARVRFKMSEEKVSNSIKGVVEMQMESRVSISSSLESGPSCSSTSSSSSVAMDVSNNQRFMSSLPLQSPPFPNPPHLNRAAINHPQQMEVVPRTNFNHNLAGSGPISLPTTQPSASTQPDIDVSQHMMNLLTRCHEVVNNVKSILGYMPYHPI